MSDTRWRIVTVSKGDANRPADVRKAQDMAVIFSFVSKLNGYPMHSGEHQFMILVPNKTEPDPKWFMDEVFRYVDIQRSTNDAEAKRMADRLIALTKEKDPEGTRYAGGQLIRMYALMMYMSYEEWEPDAIRFSAKF